MTAKWGYVAAGLAFLVLFLPGARGRALRRHAASVDRPHVSGEFLRTFDRLGGVESLGYPLAELLSRRAARSILRVCSAGDHPTIPAPLVKLSFLGERLDAASRGRRVARTTCL